MGNGCSNGYSLTAFFGGKMAKIPCGKTVKVDNPYEIWENKQAGWEWRVLKKWQIDDDKPYARWFVAVKSPYTYGNWEYGDEYVAEIKKYAVRVK